MEMAHPGSYIENEEIEEKGNRISSHIFPAWWLRNTKMTDHIYNVQNWRRIHERTISLWFLGIILRVLRLEISVYIVYVTNKVSNHTTSEECERKFCPPLVLLKLQSVLEDRGKITETARVKWIRYSKRPSECSPKGIYQLTGGRDPR